MTIINFEQFNKASFTVLFQFENNKSIVSTDLIAIVFKRSSVK